VHIRGAGGLTTIFAPQDCWESRKFAKIRRVLCRRTEWCPRDFMVQSYVAQMTFSRQIW